MSFPAERVEPYTGPPVRCETCWRNSGHRSPGRVLVVLNEEAGEHLVVCPAHADTYVQSAPARQQTISAPAPVSDEEIERAMLAHVEGLEARIRNCYQEVECPRCRAAIGVKCRSLVTQRPTLHPHRERWTMVVPAR